MKRPILRIALAASMMTAPLPVVAGGIPVIDAAAIARLALEFGELTEQGASMDTQVGQLAEQIQQGSERFQQLTEQIEQLDTQIAAGFLGVSTGSLSSLLDRFLGVDLPKGDRLTDWLRRPLTDDQLSYAASDVEFLIPLVDHLWGELSGLGRTEWVEEECALLLARPRNRRPPEEAVTRIKEARGLRGKARMVATAVAAWRERRAADLDLPVRQVLSDLGVVAVAQQAPRSINDLRALRGVDGRHIRDGAGTELLAAVQTGLKMKRDKAVQPRSPELPRHLRPVVTLVTAWVAQLARDNQLDPALLATRADVEALLRRDPECRLQTGWRKEMVGKPIAQLVSGEAAVAFDTDGHLVLEARSNRPLTAKP